ncbi:MAG: uroporphyrinogen decarboxylase family protein [bacterium]|nr:hypothetical protein [Candidatus Sumerlaeota bacterium]
MSALKHKEPDRTPLFEYVLLSPVADALLGRSYAGDPENWQTLARERGWRAAVRQEAIDRLDLAQLLGHDMLYVIPAPPPESLNPPPAPPANEPPQPEDPGERVRLRNDKWAGEPPHLSDDPFLIYHDLLEEMRQRGIDLPMLVPAYNHGIWTDTDLMQTMIIDPDAAHEHFALATRSSLAYIEKYIALDLDMIGVGGDFSGNRPIISPANYREFIAPEVAAVSRRIHAAGKWAVNASDGNLWPVIEDFLIGCEVDGYIEIDPQAGMDLRRLKELYGGRVTLFGNIDCAGALSFGTPDEVARHTIGRIEAGMGGGGHILCANNAITASVPVPNYIAAVNAYRKYFGLELLI